MIGGAGSVQSLTTSGFTDTPLRPGDVVGFTPGTIHRLVNAGDLRLAILAQNSGLPEAGDAVLTFPAPVPADLDVYRRTAVLTGDLALEGFLALRRDGGLRKFHAAAHRLKGALLDAWDVRRRAGGRPTKPAVSRSGGRLETSSTPTRARCRGRTARRFRSSACAAVSTPAPSPQIPIALP